jgi:hypothetical protein
MGALLSARIRITIENRPLHSQSPGQGPKTRILGADGRYCTLSVCFGTVSTNFPAW